MIARTQSFVLLGVDAHPCEVEAHVQPAIHQPSLHLVGLPDAAVRESLDRVRAAVVNSRLFFPSERLTINLAPADVRKEGPVYDLPIAVALLATSGTLDDAQGGRSRLEQYLLAGELALDGRVRPIRGAVSMAILARDLGLRGVVVPGASAPEAAIVEGIEVRAASNLSEVVHFLAGRGDLPLTPSLPVSQLIAGAAPPVDFRQVRGQEGVKRAITVAAAGAHNLLMVGPPGTGKTMMARALPGILPPLEASEAIEVTRIYSAAGVSAGTVPLMAQRPVRAPHHTASAVSLVGGGSFPRPGEASLAHRGVLFLDELPEFDRMALETLRQPLEDGVVTIARARATIRFPARFMLVAAMNPTPRGAVGADESPRRAMDRYLARLSLPLLDRIDLHVEAAPVPFTMLSGSRLGSDSAGMREAVLAARVMQRARQGMALNAELTGSQLDASAHLDREALALLGAAMSDLGLSARAFDRLRRVSRTIADLAGSESVRAEHMAEAVGYRLLDRGLGAAAAVAR